MINTLPWADLGIIGIIILSGLVGFVRGITRETLGLLSWGGSLFIAFYCYPYLRPLLSPYISSTLIVDVLSGLILFFLSLLILILLTKGISNQIKGSVLSGLDRTFGIFFGLGRGWILTSLAYLILTFFLNPTLWPQNIKNANLLPFVSYGAGLILEIFPDTSLPNTLKNNLPQKIVPTPEYVLNTISTLSTLSPNANPPPK